MVVLFEGLDRRTIEFRLETDVEFLKSASWGRHRSIPVFVMNLIKKQKQQLWLVMFIQLITFRGDKKNNKRHFFERLSVTLQRDNGSMLLERCPLSAADVDGEV